MTPNEFQRISDGTCLAFVLWREARAEPKEGKIALVYSILNRVQKPKWWGTSIASVVLKAWQYSSMTDPNDPQLRKYPWGDAAWPECLQVAFDVLDGKVENPVPSADSYYATYIPAPNWAKQDQFVKQIGAHRFYNTDGDHPQNTATT